MKKSVLMLCAFAMVGCTGKGDSPYGEKGKVFCNERYLIPNSGPFDETTINVATHGYMYAVAAALTLQKNNGESGQHFFATPARMRVLDNHNIDKKCFSATTFLVKGRNSEERDEIVIAYRGSDDLCDWVATNLNPLPYKKQYDQAVEYTKRMLKSYDTGKEKVVVTGISLGGGLAVHVAKSEGTSNKIDEVWAINPSPRTYSNSKFDSRIWLASTDTEVLRKTRKPSFFLVPGWGAIVGPNEQMSSNFYLIRSNSIYGHFRWNIVKQMLFVADYGLSDRGRNPATTEPLDILRASKFASCHIAKNN
ncbi:Mbeg1-like protein [Enterobacter roggenkampii]|uniref:Mbeg1-like protein n=1 Tax=Enterobacter roggenkampii TaxID=1812935 RepID=UPI002005F4C4|nr:Mbeg1-like protein [Enterobacter roggenkampii]MCK7252842.1 DUF2974 domain-containing protein [Enterobacter roggenkampii]